jgi:hypothetical protein
LRAASQACDDTNTVADGGKELHVSLETTNVYAEVGLEMKAKACIYGCYHGWSRAAPGPVRSRVVSARLAMASAFPHYSHVHFLATHSA